MVTPKLSFSVTFGGSTEISLSANPYNTEIFLSANPYNAEILSNNFIEMDRSQDIFYDELLESLEAPIGSNNWLEELEKPASSQPASIQPAFNQPASSQLASSQATKRLDQFINHHILRIQEKIHNSLHSLTKF